MYVSVMLADLQWGMEGGQGPFLSVLCARSDLTLHPQADMKWL